MRTYDPSTQRSIAPIDQIVIMPLRDVLQDNREATLFDYLARAKGSRVIVSEPDEVGANVEKIEEQLQRSYQDVLGATSGGATTRVVPPSGLFIESRDIDARLAQATTLSQLALDDNADEPDAAAPSSRAIARVRCQPAVELNGRVAEWVAEIRRLRDAG